MSATGTTPAIGAAAIRVAEPADLWAIQHLLERRDEHPWPEDTTRWFVQGLDPERCRAWLAFDGDRPVAFTNMFLRSLASPTGAMRAGYWANLFVEPEYRGQLLYPRLPLGMLAAARGLGLGLVYTTVRLRDVSLANTRIGFTRVGSWDVLMRLLRPVRLLGKFRGWRPLEWAAPPLDGAYGLALRAGRRRAAHDVTVEEWSPIGPEMEDLVRLLHAAAAGRIASAWTPETLRERYRQTRENGRFVVLGVRRAGRVAGAVVYRVAERGRGIRAGVVMDAICAPGDEASLAPALDRAERDAAAGGCEIMLFMSGAGAAIDRLFRAHGYAPGPEHYDLLVWPKERAAPGQPTADLAGWRFAFGDHDAF